MRTLLVSTLCLLLFHAAPAQAWDSTGHRLSAAIMLEYVDDETRDALLDILSAHPRYRQDFLDAMPAFVDRSNTDELALWLLGQAAYWPDIARGLPDAARRRFNRPSWHYTDGAWMRQAVEIQGNVYVDLAPFPDIQGSPSESITDERRVSNVATGLDYNIALLFDESQSRSRRAVALCWVLHLGGDIHQPLHAGSLFSPVRLRDGDRGGNSIPIDDSNLHASWDSALAADGVLVELGRVLQILDTQADSLPSADNLDWDVWLKESRQLLQSTVYSPAMIAEIRAADAANGSLRAMSLSQDYVNRMQQISRQRLGVAGRRLGNLMQARLPD